MDWPHLPVLDSAPEWTHCTYLYFLPLLLNDLLHLPVLPSAPPEWTHCTYLYLIRLLNGLTAPTCTSFSSSWMDSISRNMAIRLLKPERVDLRDSSLSSSSFHLTMMSWSLSPYVTQHHYSQTDIQHYITNITISSEKSCSWLNIYHITVNNITHCIFKNWNNNCFLIFIHIP